MVNFQVRSFWIGSISTFLFHTYYKLTDSVTRTKLPKRYATFHQKILLLVQFVRGNFRPEDAIDDISCVAEEHVAMDVPVKFSDSRSNHSRDIRAAHLVMDDERRRRRQTDPVIIG